MKKNANQKQTTPEIVVLAAVTLNDVLAGLFGPHPAPVTIPDSTR